MSRKSLGLVSVADKAQAAVANAEAAPTPQPKGRPGGSSAHRKRLPPLAETSEHRLPDAPLFLARREP